MFGPFFWHKKKLGIFFSFNRVRKFWEFSIDYPQQQKHFLGMFGGQIDFPDIHPRRYFNIPFYISISIFFYRDMIISRCNILNGEHPIIIRRIIEQHCSVQQGNFRIIDRAIILVDNDAGHFGSSGGFAFSLSQ